MKRVITSLLICASPLFFTQPYAQPITNVLSAEQAPKNIIMIVGDGMGPAYTSAYRYFKDDPNTPEIEETVFDRHLVGMSSTYPARVSGYVTDSAASATALATGIKSYNGAIGVNVDKEPLESVLVWANKHGKKTAVVVTSQINHATPASYLSHNESRKNYNQIADSYIDNGIKVDLMLGGGWQYFIRQDRNLVNEFKQAGFYYLDNYADLNNLPMDQPILGLFADKGLPWALDDSDKHRLSTMTKAATQYLDNVQLDISKAKDKQGYFMLIEASQIDWAGHSNDIAAAMAEMDDLAKTLEFLEAYVQNNPETLVVVTADHSTGGFTIAAGGKYLWQPEILRTMQMSAKAISKQLQAKNIDGQLALQLFNFELTKDEITQLITDKDSAQQALKAYQAKAKDQQHPQSASYVLKTLYKSVTTIINNRTRSGWTTGGHTAVDVPVLAFGKQSERFNGYQDNTDIAKKIFTLLGKK